METSERNSLSSSNTEDNHAKTVYRTFFKSPESESEFDLQLYKKDIEKRLKTSPDDFKHCKLEIERHDQAYARPLDEPMLSIKIYGRENVGRSFPGDEVCVEILSREQCPQEGEVVKGRVVGLIKRDENSLIFICKMVEEDPQLVTPINKRITRIRTVQNKSDTDKIEVRQFKCGRWVRKEFVKIAQNQMLVVKVLKWDSKNMFPLGVVTSVIPECDALREMLCIELGFKDKPPPLKPEPEDSKAVERKDLRKINKKEMKSWTFTIDPDTAEDLDDAISVTEMDDYYQIGVHITDVASCINKDSEPDKFAKWRGRTIYPSEKEDVAFMFSRDLSNGHLSLMPKKDRKAISLLLDVEKKTSTIRNCEFYPTFIRSERRMSYEEADKIIKIYSCSDDTKPLQISCVEDCVAVAHRFSEVHRKCRLEGGWPCGRQAEQSLSHAMVEELMNLYNSAVAEKLISTDVTKDLTPLRCHREPDPQQLIQFREKYINLIPMSLYFSNICEVDTDIWSSTEYDHTEHAGISLKIFTSIFHKMEAFAQSKDYYKMMQLIFSDEIHPTFIPMVREFRDIQKKAVILQSCSSTESRLGHYDLRLDAYTWASSPMRRYLDVILQRLLHTALSKKYLPRAEYTKVEISEFCQSGMEAEEKEALVLRLKTVQFEPKNVAKLAVVDQITPQGHEFTISFPLHPHLEVIAIMYKHLNVVDQPRYNKDKNSMTLKWKRRVYSFRESFKISSKPMKNVTSVSSTMWKRLVSATKQKDWVKIDQCLRDIRRKDANEETKSLKSEACSIEHYKETTMELDLGTVVQVQLGTEYKDGFPVPVVLLLNINESFEICLEHTRNPTLCFSKTECNASKTFYESDKEYQNIWRQLCQIDTAHNAVEENNSVILENVHIKWSGDETNLQGFFNITTTQKKQWSLEFDLRNCFLCIRLRHQKPNEKDGSAVSDLQGSLPFTWVAHAVTTKPKKQKNPDNEDRIHFQITKRSMSYVPPEVNAEQTKFTIEVIPKQIPYVLREQAIANLRLANNLVKNVATRQHLEELNDDAYEENVSLYDVDESLNLPRLNESQQKAVEEAMKKPFTVIQGPPGTGKTVVGIHIVYQFFMKNKEFLASSESPKSTPDQKPPKTPAILYCGPSNKSVDIVAEQLLKLRGVLKPLRIYCDQMEMCEFPYLGSSLKLCRRSLRDEKPKEELRRRSCPGGPLLPPPRRRRQHLRLLIAEGVRPPPPPLPPQHSSSLHPGVGVEPAAGWTSSPLRPLPSQVASTIARDPRRRAEGLPCDKYIFPATGHGQWRLSNRQQGAHGTWPPQRKQVLGAWLALPSLSRWLFRTIRLSCAAQSASAQSVRGPTLRAYGARATQPVGASGQLGEERALPDAEVPFSRFGAGFGRPDSAPHQGARPVGVEQLEFVQMQDSGPTETISEAPGAYGIWSCAFVAQGAPYETTSMLTTCTWHSGSLRVLVTPRCRHTFRPWSNPVFLRAGVPLEQVSRHSIVSTDASSTGWDAKYNGLAVSGLRTGPQLQWHINCLELLAVRLDLSRVKTLLQGKHVLVRMESTAVVAYMNKQGGLRSRRISQLARHLLLWSLKCLRSLRATHILGRLKRAADEPSRQPVLPGERRLHPQTLQGQGGRRAGPVGGAILAQQDMVLGTGAPCDSTPLAHSSEEGPPDSETGHPLAPASRPLETPCLVPGWDAEFLGGLPQADTIASARAPSTRHLYALKPPKMAVLSFLQDGLERRLSPSPLKVYVAAIAAHHKLVEGKSLGKHDLIIRFLRGASRLNPPRPPSIPSWDLSLVLSALQRPPFEPLQSVELKILSLKTVLLTALASIKRVGDLQAYSADESCLEFGPDYSHVILRPRPSQCSDCPSPIGPGQPLGLPYEALPTASPYVYRKTLKEAHRHEIRKYDVVLCTCASALKPEIREVMDFRQILIDECAMATEPEAFIPLVSHNPQKIVLLGDHKQIRPIVQCALVKKMGMQQSLFERYMDLAIMLDTQYRMHEEICRFPSEQFYEGKLTTAAKRGPPCLLNKYGVPTPILFGHIEGEEVSLVVSTEKGNENSMANTEEAKQAVNVAHLLITEAHVEPQSIAILTPYNAQVSEIKKEMQKKDITNVTVCTIMKSQGSEWPYVIISTVRSCSVSDIERITPSKGWMGKRLGFITDPNQVNVAITRAQDGLCILGNSDLLRCCKLWNRLLDHYYRKSCVVNPASNIRVEERQRKTTKQKKRI
ncbi:3'-5' exoribonuclease HELZ2-like [Pseudorasbora parva]|uniref:3'-5' exoribonuclease HELZ2-like n=1 Tax=Pseudorasbora parva TaxID=51549 RepID=UPI00351DE143